MNKHLELKKTYEPGQQWQFRYPDDRCGWEDCYQANEPKWVNALDYRLKP